MLKPGGARPRRSRRGVETTTTDAPATPNADIHLMDILAAIPQYGLSFLVLLTVLVFVHEYGHYKVARWCGVRVEVFSIGFGPELFGRTDAHGTRWKFSAIPLGGYVKMFGQGTNLLEGEAGKALTEADRLVAFDYKSVWRRMAIVAAGPIANYIFAALILAVVFAVHGREVAAPVIGDVQPGSAAYQAGLKPGDRVLSLNGATIGDFDDIREFIQLNLDQELTITVDRSGTVETVTARPTITTEKDAFGNEVRLGRLGILAAGKAERVEMSVVDSVVLGVKRVFEISGAMLKGLWQMVTGVRPADELGGVIRIGYLSGEIAQFGLWSLITFA